MYECAMRWVVRGEVGCDMELSARLRGDEVAPKFLSKARQLTARDREGGRHVEP